MLLRQHLFTLTLCFVLAICCILDGAFRLSKFAGNKFLLLSDTTSNTVLTSVVFETRSNMSTSRSSSSNSSGTAIMTNEDVQGGMTSTTASSTMSKIYRWNKARQQKQHPNQHYYAGEENQSYLAPLSSYNDDDDNTQAAVIKNEYDLQTTKLKFFLYDDPNITLKYPSPVWPKEASLNRKAWRMCANEIMFDESLFVVLEQSPLRTFNPEEAHVFIAPIPNGRIFGSMQRNELWSLSLNLLVQREEFKKHHGNRHLLIATGFPLFRYYVGSLAQYYDLLHNVTLVQSWDPNGVAKALRDGYDFHEYQEIFSKFQPVTRSSISVGLATKPDSSVIPLPDFKFGNFDQIPLKIASMDKWRNATNFIFYHTRVEGSFHNSTIYRQVAVTNVTRKNLPKSSIGWGIASKTEWMQEYTNSKFCLVIRGDSPHSKAFLRSIRVGCIPVVVADCLPIYAPVLKSTLKMSDYTIMLDEKKFVEDPEGQLLSLLNFSEKEIENKIKHLAFAQKVTMMDHPESLFVPALLHEAVVTFKTSDH